MKIGKRLAMLIIIVVILLIPLIAMQFTSEVEWSFFDFVVAGALLILTAALLDLVFKRVKQKKKRIAIGVVVVVMLLVIWAELAVGLFGTPFSGN